MPGCQVDSSGIVDELREGFKLPDLSPAGRVRLDVVAGPHNGQKWSFDRPVRVVIGRQAPAHLRLGRETSCSTAHCELVIDPPTISVTDLSSTNGTLVNGIPIADAVLGDGDEFGVGETRIRVSIFAAAASSLPEHDVAAAEPTADRTVVLEPAALPKLDISSQKLTAATARDDRRPQAPLAETEFHFSADGVASADPVNKPSFCGPYQLEEQIGQGGMATVFRALHRKTRQQVAIKLIRTASVSSDKMLQLFVREASVLLRLSHPRIVRSIEFGFQEQQPYLVLEWLPVIDLLEFIDPLPFPQKVRLSCWTISRVLQALEYAHQQGFVHRDVKPSNILAYREAHRLQVKLGDFGLAKCYDDAGLSAMTDDYSVRGTLAYMSPEQLHDSRSVGPKSDLFSAAACLYRLLTGKHPKMTARGVECDPAVLKAAKLPPQLFRWIESAMQPAPDKRPKNAAVMQRHLQPYHGK